MGREILVILKIISSIYLFLKTEEISFVLLPKLHICSTCCVNSTNSTSLGMKSNHRQMHHTLYKCISCYEVWEDGF